MSRAAKRRALAYGPAARFGQLIDIPWSPAPAAEDDEPAIVDVITKYVKKVPAAAKERAAEAYRRIAPTPPRVGLPRAYAPGSFAKTLRMIAAGEITIPLLGEHEYRHLFPANTANGGLSFHADRSNLYARIHCADTLRGLHHLRRHWSKVCLSLGSTDLWWTRQRDAAGREYVRVEESIIFELSLVEVPAVAGAELRFD